MYKLFTLATVMASLALADVVNISESERGWVCTPGASCNNGAGAGNNFIAGSHAGQEFRDWFEFAIPTLTGGPLVSATLNLWEASAADAFGAVNGHSGGALIFAVYGLSAQPLIFTDVTTANPFGSAGTSDASDGTTVSITLNAAALAAITADQSSNIFIGGVDSGESGSEAFDFAGSHTSLDPKSTGVLSLTTAPLASVPEPSPFAALLLLSSAVILLGRRRKIRA